MMSTTETGAFDLYLQHTRSGFVMFERCLFEIERLCAHHLPFPEGEQHPALGTLDYS